MPPGERRRVRRGEVVAMLRQHLRNNLVRIGGGWHVQSRGIPQARPAHAHPLHLSMTSHAEAECSTRYHRTHTDCQLLATCSQNLNALRVE